eukprot:scaffold5679_cov410-Prasinococcus_capsulatus_cf.AAC.4
MQFPHGWVNMLCPPASRISCSVAIDPGGGAPFIFGLRSWPSVLSTMFAMSRIVPYSSTCGSKLLAACLVKPVYLCPFLWVAWPHSDPSGLSAGNANCLYSQGTQSGPF